MSFIKRYTDMDEEKIKQISERNKLPLLLAKALYFRGIRENEQISAFLHPKLDDMHDPFLLPDMQKAVDRLERALKLGERICVYGDYDADGICAVAIIMLYLKKVGADAFYYLPSRINEGYGMNPTAINSIAKRGAKLIVSVDNGVTAIEEIKRCTELSIDVIVTDHHQCLNELPQCEAVVDAHREDSRYPYRHLCGAGIALKLVQAMREDIQSYLPLAALATVADVVPLTDENRIIVYHGLKHISDNLGLRELILASGSSANDIDCDTLAFRLAPRINAAGRMGDPSRALELLLTGDSKLAHELALTLNDENTSRQREETRIFKEAETMLESENIARLPAIILSCADWSPGVIGIVASRLVEKYYRPALLFYEKDGVLTGSCRSIKGINIFKCIDNCSDKLIRHGGHSMAAGLAIKAENFDEFKRGIFEQIKCFDIPAEREYYYEMEAEFRDFSVESINSLAALAPHGEANPRPIFLTTGVKLYNAERIGLSGAHLRVFAAKGGCRMPAVAFGFGEREREFAGEADILYTIEVNNWMDQAKIQMQLCALSKKEDKNARSAEERKKFYDDFFVTILYNVMNKTKLDIKDLSALKPLCMDRDEMGRIYKDFIKKLAQGPKKKQALVAGLAYDKKTLALLVFLELGLLSYNDSDNTILMQEDPPKRKLFESSLYTLANT